MRALQFSEFGSVSNLRLIDLPDPQADSATAIVKIAAGAISPSDVKNVEGKMEGTTLPRVPGRDYSGTVIHGPAEWIGAEVWGTRGRDRLLCRWQSCRVDRRSKREPSPQAQGAVNGAGRGDRRHLSRRLA